VNDPYVIPTSATPKRPPEGMKLLWAGIALFVLGPVAGLAGTVLGMLDSFQKIEELKAPTPQDLDAGVWTSLTASFVGLAVGGLGFVLVIVATIRLNRAARESEAYGSHAPPVRA